MKRGIPLQEKNVPGDVGWGGGSKCFPFRADHVSEGSKNNVDKVVYLESVLGQNLKFNL